MKSYIFHILPNAHLDPVWLWDWREGLNEGLITCKAALDLMDENPSLTFLRGEVFIYEHIEKTDPAMFKRIAKYVKAGRWDVVGGTLIQPDTNLPATETFARHYLRGQRYFTKKFGKPVQVAWCADSFGHAWGLPEVYAQAGIKYFAFTRAGNALDDVDSPAFWWEGPGGSRVLAYHPKLGWYGCERHETTPRLDGLLADAAKHSLKHVGVFVGLGNHGGGPTRQQLADIAAWGEKHPEVELRYSGLHGFFAALEKDLGRKGLAQLPVVRKELNFCLRGCYASMAKLKFAYRKTEAIVARTEKTEAIISTIQSPAEQKKAVDLHSAWDAVLLNSFHDILPGSSIERAYDEQLAWLGGAIHDGLRGAHTAISALALQIDTSVKIPEGDVPAAVPMLLWNPHPMPYRGLVEIEAALDARPIWKYANQVDALPISLLDPDGKPAPFQKIPTEHHAMVNLPWRYRLAVPVEIGPFGYAVYRVRWEEAAAPPPAPKHPASSPGEGVIENHAWKLEARIGEETIKLWKDGKPIFGEGGIGNGGMDAAGIGVRTYEDPWGSWGGMSEEQESFNLTNLREKWKITDVRLTESGPQRATLWVRFDGGHSWLTLTCQLCADQSGVVVHSRILWNERSARVKLIFPAQQKTLFDVPGGEVERQVVGEVPGGRWAKIQTAGGPIGFISDALYGFESTADEFRATICRASRYADDVKTGPEERPWQPAADAGELRFTFLLTDEDRPLWQIAEQLEQPVIAQHCVAHPGPLGRSGSLGEIAPASLQLLALKPAEDGNGLIARLHNRSDKSAAATMRIGKAKVRLGSIKPRQIGTFRLTHSGKAWVSRAQSILEI